MRGVDGGDRGQPSAGTRAWAQPTNTQSEVLNSSRNFLPESKSARQDISLRCNLARHHHINGENRWSFLPFLQSNKMRWEGLSMRRWWRWWLHSATMSIYLCHFMHMQSMQFACAGADIYIHNCIGSCQQETRSIWYFWNAVAFWEDLRFCICAGRLGALLMLLLVIRWYLWRIIYSTGSVMFIKVSAIKGRLNAGDRKQGSDTLSPRCESSLSDFLSTEESSDSERTFNIYFHPLSNCHPSLAASIHR